MAKILLGRSVCKYTCLYRDIYIIYIHTYIYIHVHKRYDHNFKGFGIRPCRIDIIRMITGLAGGFEMSGYIGGSISKAVVFLMG